MTVQDVLNFLARLKTLTSDGAKVAYVQQFLKKATKEEKTEQCFCQSMYNGQTEQVENCTCGKCQESLTRK